MFLEVVHAFIKPWFWEVITPLGVGVGSDARFSEAGYLGDVKLKEGILR
jgi:hypothetical protein